VNEALSPDTDVEAAIARVLGAEQAACESIAAAHADAAQRAERARAAARALAERTQRRIRRLRDTFERHLAAEVGAIEARALALAGDDTPGVEEVESVQRAVTRLAAQLTGGAP
jgi:hypothetical protein